MSKKTKTLPDVQVGDTWMESDPRLKEVPHRLVVSVDDEHVMLAHCAGPLVGRKPARVKRARFNGGTTGYRLVHRPDAHEMATALSAWERVAGTWYLGDVSVDGTENAYVHQRIAQAKAGAGA